jgi:hypothetical protein
VLVVRTHGALIRTGVTDIGCLLGAEKWVEELPISCRSDRGNVAATSAVRGRTPPRQ